VSGGTAECDVAVIGGGPAGLTAALRLATAGLSVVIVDEQPELGGQYYRRPSPAMLARGIDHRPAGGRLIAAVRAAGVDCRTGTSVWGVGDDGRTLLTCPVLGPATSGTLKGRYVVVATGAYERLVPFPGWDLPGVTTAGFAQHLAAADGVAVGQRVLLAGSGPFLLPVACSLLELGVSVAGIAEAGVPYRVSSQGALTAARFPARLAELAGYAARLARHRVPVWQDRIVARADADQSGQRVGSVTLAATSAPGTPVATVRADALCVGMGFRPQAELPPLLGCAMRPDPRSGELVPAADATGRSGESDLYLAGETAGIGGARRAMADGEVVAAAILAREGRAGSRRGPTARARHRARQQRFADAVARLYPAGSELARGLGRALPDEARACRCEAVTAGQIRAAAAAVGSPADPGAVRALTRAGMGPCQGRECLATVAALCGQAADLSAQGAPVTERQAITRMPVRPVPLATIAALSLSSSPAPPARGAGQATP
jgi:D-hydroxyproline dehydrogenase subunit alpha